MDLRVDEQQGGSSSATGRRVLSRLLSSLSSTLSELIHNALLGQRPPKEDLTTGCPWLVLSSTSGNIEAQYDHKAVQSSDRQASRVEGAGSRSDR